MLVVLSILSFPADSPPADAAMGVRWGYYVGYDKTTSLPSLEAHVRDLNYVSPWYNFQIQADGRLTGADDPYVTGLARSAGAKVVPLVQNSAKYDDFHKLLADRTKRSAMVSKVVRLVLDNNYHGVNIDFESVTATDRPYLTAFMAELYPKLHDQGKLVTMAVPAKTWDATTGWAGAYDYAALKPYSDLFVIMAYDFHYAGGSPGSISPIDWVRKTTAYALQQFGAGKLIVGMALYGYDWNTTTGAKATSTKFSDIAKLRNTYNATLSYDTVSQSAKAVYTRDGQRHEVWYENGRSLDAKLAAVRQMGATGVGVWRLGQEDPRVWNSIRGLSIGLSSHSFSPNSDGYQDSVALSYRTEVTATVKVQVLNASGQVVRTLQQPVSQSAGGRSLRWDGRADGGATLSNGRYTVRVTASVGGSPVSDSSVVTINNTLRRLTTSHVRYAPARGSLSGSYTVVTPSHLTVTVRQGTRLVRTLAARAYKGSGTYSLTWDGRDSTGARVKEGGYYVSVLAESSVGRISLDRSLYVDVRAPELTDVRLSTPRFYVNGATVQNWNYSLGETAQVELKISRRGQVIRTLRATQAAGRPSLRWNGYEGSALAPAGTYGYSLTATDSAGNRTAAVTGSFTVAR